MKEKVKKLTIQVVKSTGRTALSWRRSSEWVQPSDREGENPGPTGNQRFPILLPFFLQQIPKNVIPRQPGPTGEGET